MITLDAIKQIEIEGSLALNELTTMRSLRAGLAYLASVVEGFEQPIAAEEQAGGTQIVSWGNSERLPRTVIDLLPNVFNWYSISLVSYLRLVAFLEGLEKGTFVRNDLVDRSKFDKIAGLGEKYVDSLSEFAAPVQWRHKVAAHPAITYPRKSKGAAHDNMATMEATVMHPIAYSNHRLGVNELKFAKTDSRGEMQASELRSWSLTEMQETFLTRFPAV